MPESSSNALRVLEARYLRRDAQGRVVETPSRLFRRVADAVAAAETAWGGGEARDRWAETFRLMMERLEFLPNSPTLMNAGTPLGQLSACFVLPVEDTMEGIFEAVKRMAVVQKTGGGTGFSFSRLRPRGSFLGSTGGEASGPVSFMKIFDAATENIKQGGRRRGANMGILRADHPDILEFIDAKRDGKTLQNFNISVGATDAFLRAARAGKTYDLIHPATRAKAGRLKAREVFDRIAEAAWETGDPGLIFLDTINRANPTPRLGTIEATNPCGEIPLLPYEACNLGSINLSRMVTRKGRGFVIDWKRLGETVRKGIRFLDDVVEANRYPFPEIDRMCRGNRKIGLGVMGFAELLLLLGVPYDAPKAASLGERVMRFIAGEAREASRRLAKERGPFPNWKGSVHERRRIRLRNAALTAVAPTGTISIIAGTSSGIEPLFALAYRRRALEGKTLVDANPVFLAHLKENGLSRKDILRKVLEKGHLKDVEGIPEHTRRLFATALDIPPDRHLAIQAAFQKHVDNSVSKTINLPAGATPDDVADAYWRAWDLGLKGITIYRYGSKPTQVLELGTGEDPMQQEFAIKCDPSECRL
ncbi:MAG TPA: adenosylcobalamin-dependent ribonucleoside-diphosphate reductase [bacterium]|nr:adenosylcobalamin-dependent ribonucleoside-diphosphate reductase [bacterium]